MRDEETIKRAKEIHTLHQNGNEKEAKHKFKQLIEETLSWCNHCKKYVPIELDKATKNKPFYFCIYCGEPVKKMALREDRVVELRFHKTKKVK